VKNENKMREIRVAKVTLNIGTGRPGESVERAKAVLHMLTGRKPVSTRTVRRTTFGVAKGREIGCKVTLRKAEAIEFLRRAFEAVDNRIKATVFNDGNFSFGIVEYLDIPGANYDPKIGIFGLDVCVTLERPGYRIKRRKIKSKIGKRHLIKREEAIQFIKSKFGVDII
jgi:large subunit ribosomal protein L5